MNGRNAWIGLVLCAISGCRPAPAPGHPAPTRRSPRGPIDPSACSNGSRLLTTPARARSRRALAADRESRGSGTLGKLRPIRRRFLLARSAVSSQDVASSMFLVFGKPARDRLRPPEHPALPGGPRSSTTCAGAVGARPRSPKQVQPWWAPTQHGAGLPRCPPSQLSLSRPGTDWQCGSVKLALGRLGGFAAADRTSRICFPRFFPHRKAVLAQPAEREHQDRCPGSLDHEPAPSRTLFTGKRDLFAITNVELVVYTNWRVLNGETVTYPDPHDWPG